jgi:hypothetical protein
MGKQIDLMMDHFEKTTSTFAFMSAQKKPNEAEQIMIDLHKDMLEYLHTKRPDMSVIKVKIRDMDILADILTDQKEYRDAMELPKIKKHRYM